MKKLFCALTALALCLSVSGCARPAADPAAASSSAPAPAASVSAPDGGQDGSGRFDCVYGGAAFYVPDGFEPAEPDDRPAAGYLYLFKNPELDMTIEVSEVSVAQLPVDAAAALKTEYDAACADPGVTWHDSGDGWWAASGLRADGAEIWYTKGLRGGGEFYYRFTASYPTEKRQVCDGIVTEFERTFCR